MANTTKISVMIVDDSNIVRSFLREEFKNEPQIEIVAHASNGLLALPRIRHYQPRVLLLDYEMPRMDGLATLAEIKNLPFRPAVIMFSSHTVEGAKVTMEALRLGASDFVTKPDFGADGDARLYIRDILIPRIKELGRSRYFDSAPETETSEPSGAPAVSPGITGKEFAGGAFSICGIGISTGGPQALRKLLPTLPENLDGVILVTIHMPPHFTAQMAGSLDRECRLRVKEGEAGEPLKRGTVYIAPGGKHMLVDPNGGAPRIQLDDGPAENNSKPSVNVMFRSLAKVNPRNTMAIIMTGMGNDGYEGLKVLKEKGAYLLAQNKASCMIYGMPARPTEEQLVRESLDIRGLGDRLVELLGTR